jgi:hypothetical protein
MSTFGFPQSDWDKATQEARETMIAVAKGAVGTITYGELARRVSSISFPPDAHPFHSLLGEISRSENIEGRGMLSVVVVRKGGDGRPGPGFFKLAQELGRDISDRDRFWAAEFDFVRQAWKLNRS